MMEKYTLAKEWIEKSMSNGGQNGVILEHYGDILDKLGEADNAVKYWKQAKEKGGASPLLDKKLEGK